jgi:type II secretory pathway component PulF
MFSYISDQDRVDFAKNLAIMIKSGIPIDDALDSLAEQAHSKFFGRLIAKVKNDIEYGTPVAAAFAKEDRHFGHIFSSLLKAAESSGTMEENLIFLSDWLERNHDLKQDIKGATFYPKIVIGATLTIGLVLGTYVLPKLAPLFSQLDVALPLSTRIMMAVAYYLQHSWWQAILIAGAFFVGMSYLNRLRFMKAFWHRLFLSLPIMGPMYREYQLAIISQLLSTLVRGGLLLSDALVTTQQAATNYSYQNALKNISLKVERGTALAPSLSDYPKLFPKNFVNIVATGEKSGSLENSLGYLADFYIKEVSVKSKKLPSMIEPVLLILIALGVLFVAVSVLLPIYSMTQVIS